MSTDPVEPILRALPEVERTPAEAARELLGIVDPTPEPEWEIETAAEICALPADTQESLLGEILVRGNRTVLMGDSGHGKSTMALAMMKAVAEGGYFLDTKCDEPQPVLCIDTEQGLRSIQRKLRKASLEHADNVYFLRVPDGLDLPKNEGQVRRLEAILAEGADGQPFALVALDPIYKAYTGDSNEERTAVEFMRLWDTWRVRYGFCFLCQMHTRKPVPGDMTLRMSDCFGTGAWTRIPEVVIGIQRIEESPPRAKLYFFKDRDGELPISSFWILGFTPDDADFQLLEKKEDKKVVRTVSELVIGYLRDKFPENSTIDQMQVIIGRSSKAIKGALRDFEETGEVERVGSIMHGRGGRPSPLWVWRPADGDLTRADWGNGNGAQ